MKVHKRLGLALTATALALGVIAAPAAAAVDFDAATGTGFVGKGDVQYAFGWNNKALNDYATGVTFSVSSTTEQTWECTNTNNEHIQERSRTTSTQGLLSHVERDNKKQITGFLLNGYDGGSLTIETEGPPLNSCPGGPWTLTTPAGDPVLAGSGGVSATYNGTTVPLQ